jgi:parallel beta-helix repeat protein
MGKNLNAAGGGAGGDAVITVAANNTPAAQKARADFTCTGANDDATIEALVAAGVTVKLMVGDYVFNNPLDIVVNNFRLEGSGPGTVIGGVIADAYIRVGDGSTTIHDVTICDLAIDGTSQTNGGGIDLDGAIANHLTYIEVINCRISNTDDEAILTNYVYNSSIAENIIHDINGDQSIYFGRIYYSTLTDNIIYNTVGHGIRANYADYNVIADNNIVDAGGISIYLSNSEYSIVESNLCHSAGSAAIAVESNSRENVIADNICRESEAEGILITADRNNIVGNSCIKNSFHGISLQADECSIIGNYLTQNSQSSNNAYDDIYLEVADENHIQGNLCSAGAQLNKPRYGINVTAGCADNIVIDNDLFDDGFQTAPFNDAGTDTRLNTYKVPFSDGQDPQDSGYLIDADTEYARAWLRLPDKVAQVVRMKVYARSVVTEADKMRAEFVVYGAADNENYQTHNGSIANHPSSSSNFAADDVIYWTLTTAGVLALLGGDSVEVKVIHEAAGNGDCATDGYFRTVEIEYV